ncbi:MAG: PAC2 family protein, partial [Actinomycetota bacterium]|nr:PAC2 family protein [Actinomycetota bacterium]
PTVRLVEGITRRIDWPANDLFLASAGGRPVGLLIGIEPNVRWRTYCDAIIDAARQVGVGTLITLGAFLADIPHTVDSPVAGSAGDPKEAARLGLSATRYEGPTGVVGVLNDRAGRAELPSISLWAAVPHYLPAGPNPKAALALVRKLSQVLDVEVETDTLARAATAWQAQVTEMIEENEELRSYVQRLEESRGDGDELEIPSGEALAAELERFLRQRREDGEG